MLFSLVFGEGVVNDAVSIVLLRAVQGIRCVWARACPCGGIMPARVAVSCPSVGVDLQPELVWRSMRRVLCTA